MKGSRFAAAWREPAFIRPVLVLESDDWGADAPGRVAEQAAALEALVRLLTAIRDGAGRSAIMTIGLVAGIIDRDAWRRHGHYRRLTLDHPSQVPVLAALQTGVEAGVFAIQWHGLEHYWPEALVAARDEPPVAAWLAEEASTEALPDAFQSRWVDGSRLPTPRLPREAIEQAVAEEAALLAQWFGAVPPVAVPNTFVWNDDVESAWHRAGVQWVITPGCRYSGRDAQARLIAERCGLYNGAPSPTGVRYLVRDVYFEPARGHGRERLLAGLARKIQSGRPCLVETHRFNYVGEGAPRAREELLRALEQALQRHPNLRFLSSAELGDVLARRDPAWVRAPAPAQCWARLAAP
ncbi:MAG: hypothetical protein WHV61_06220 [Burkholderiales bacterium]